MDELKILNMYERIYLRKVKFMFNNSKILLESNVFLSIFNETLQSLRLTGALVFYTPMSQKEMIKQCLSYLEQFTRLAEEFRSH